MDQAIVDFTSGKRIAVVGVSRKSTGFGRMAYKELAQRGYQVYAVNREAQEMEGAPCYPDLAPLADQVDGVLVVVPPQDGAPVLRQAAELGIRNVWLQSGAESPELVALARELGLNAVAGKCILMYAQPVRSFHRWHRGWVKLTGKL
jgi:predicted CoA-binding protein